MATMKTLKFPGSNNVYEMVDATARAGVASLQTAVGGLVDDTLAISGKAADAAATGAALAEKADELSDLKSAFDDLTENVYSKYSSYISGSIRATGDFGTTANWVRTDFIPVDELFKVIKPVNVSMRLALYEADNTNTWITNINYAYTTAIASELASMISTYPTTKYVAIGLQKYVNGSVATFTPSDVDSTGFEIISCLIPAIPNVIQAINSMDNIIYENLTLTSDMSFTLKNGRNFYKNIIVSVDAIATLSGDTPCTITALRNWEHPTSGAHNTYYGSPAYVIGENEKRKQIQFRLPCGVYGMDDYILNIVVPSGSSLKIYQLSFDFDDTICRESTISLNAHGGCGYGGPHNTRISFAMAAKLGYKYCITIPKVTKDGIYVCYHDDDNIASLRNPDGTTIDSSITNHPISYFNYDDLLQYDAGILRGKIFGGEKVPLLADFFKICAETGMHPMLSVHPALSGHWANIKALAKKYNVLHVLNIKSSTTNLYVPMETLVNDIESYTVDINDSTTDAVEYMDGLVSAYSIDKTKVKLGIEYFYDYVTDSRISDALNAGYFVSVANINSSVYDAYTSLIEKGVTQFTDDYMPCIGLMWY